MAVTQKTLRSNTRAQLQSAALPQRLSSALYVGALLLAAVAIYLLVSLLLGKAQVFIDDFRYGRPRTTQLEAFVGHNEANGQPTHLLALNLNRQAVIIEQARTITGPYMFGADADLTPLTLSLRDMNGDGHVDLLLNIRNEQVVYVNTNGTFRLPTPAEQAALAQGNSR
jgi:hypothetical protein